MDFRNVSVFFFWFFFLVMRSFGVICWLQRNGRWRSDGIPPPFPSPGSPPTAPPPLSRGGCWSWVWSPLSNPARVCALHPAPFQLGRLKHVSFFSADMTTFQAASANWDLEPKWRSNWTSSAVPVNLKALWGNCHSSLKGNVVTYKFTTWSGNLKAISQNDGNVLN